MTRIIVNLLAAAAFVFSVWLFFRVQILGVMAFFLFVLLYILARGILCKGDKCPKL